MHSKTIERKKYFHGVSNLINYQLKNQLRSFNTSMTKYLDRRKKTLYTHCTEFPRHRQLAPGIFTA